MIPIKAIFAAIVIASSLSAMAEKVQHPTKTQINWGVYTDQPPIFITAGKHKGMGMADSFYDTLEKTLPNHQHRRVEAKLLRVIAKISAKEQICSVMFKTPERELKIQFSDKAIGLLPAPKLAIKRENLANFKKLPAWQDNKVSLTKLLNEENELKLGLNAGSSYGLAIDNAIKNADNPDRVYRHSGHASRQALIRMLLANRVDYIFDYSFVIKYILQQDIHRVSMIPLTESPEYIEVFIGCPKNPWGQSILNHINPAIESVRDHSVSNIEKWLTADEISSYRKNYRERFSSDLHQ